MIKKEIRVLGVSFAEPNVRAVGPIHIVGVVYRGNRWLEGVMRTTVPPGRADITPRIAKMVRDSPHYPQLRIIILDRLTTKYGNYVDLDLLSKKTRLPSLAVLQHKISSGHISGAAKRALASFAKLTYTKWSKPPRPLFVYSAGLDKMDLGEVLEVCASSKGIPEAARVARITASSIERLLLRHTR